MWYEIHDKFWDVEIGRRSKRYVVFISMCLLSHWYVTLRIPYTYYQRGLCVINLRIIHEYLNASALLFQKFTADAVNLSMTLTRAVDATRGTN